VLAASGLPRVTCRRRAHK